MLDLSKQAIEGNTLTNQLEKVNLSIGTRLVPGLVVSAREQHPVELASGRTIQRPFADVLSYRETNPDGENPGITYLTVTRENMGFATRRFNQVEGLDVDENGAFYTFEQLETKRGEDILAQQARNQPASAAL
jgi:hypothetical protein